MSELKKIGKVFLYLFSAIFIVQLAKWVGVPIEDSDIYLVGIFNIATYSIIRLFKGE